jgi:hypothetical protein
MKKEVLGGVGQKADQDADGGNGQLRYFEVIAQHFEIHDFAVAKQARRRPSTVVDVLLHGTGLNGMTNPRASGRGRDGAIGACDS